MAKTYTPIATQTLSTATATVTFSSIPATYTDLVIVCSLGAASAGQDFKLQFNGDTATNYSTTIFRGSSTRSSNASFIYLDYTGATQNVVQSQYNININNYSNTTTYKTVLTRFSDATNNAEANVGLWRSTAAINSIALAMTSGNLIVGSTFTLYGILKAQTMAYTYSKISTYTVGSGGVASVSFLNIPQNYTDLIIKASVRNTRSGAAEAELRWTANGSSTSYSNRLSQGNGSSVSAGSYATTFFYSGEIDAATATASTFGSAEIYIPNYSGSNYKSASADTVSENNATSAYATMTAGLWSNTEPITSITFYYSAASIWAQHSTFHLYGIKAEL